MATTGKKSGAKAASAPSKELVLKYMSLAIDNSPKQIQPYMKKATPYVIKVVDFVELMVPIVLDLYAKANAFWISIQCYKPMLLVPTFVGFVLCFFGGSFVTTIAAVEAWNMCGYASTLECVKMLLEESKHVVEENEKDDQKDDDHDGVADVLQISSTELLSRKSLLFLKVVEPERVSNALTGITAGCMAVMAALKLEFAKTIALGNAIAGTVQRPCEKYLLPPFEQAVPVEYRKWCRPAMVYTIKGFAVSVAWTVQRVISALHSAMRGGLMLSRNLLQYLHEMNILHIDAETSVMDEVAGYALAALGLYFQLSYGFSLPFPLNVLLFPFTLLEYLLLAMISK
ncbi:hypothetical protein B484DRAFT_442232 [Ochromonadaceae sp. CCMP2298]|nr:hypothetical protein B484DRAFT_442232 [Ochromonadaceae sp. CCMP2298]|eukprot:CAMPEP_0173177326 /NCGR_PEP_ID=MMETSP1141-20130122/4929_1 /TAXON_ID=483371 /ORGANISM="non described non described, Strain CCMP2298" /LENGTH=342 /DNA_ID=CAMNT_0014099715 /DNA_START=73 /DNA_END=1101 /DNA_ORIENTATION=+